ncbi:MAG: 50S ribosomal protein L3 N(5)-glutamine methyltransferase [Pseudomonadales bacterium]|nr:50S ribosomal protein L3 N(5)-glutamine methyltransferase [Pseudomonadales bacterium]
MLLAEYINNTAQLFANADLHFGHGTDNAIDEAVYLVYSGLGINFAEDFRSSRRVLSTPELHTLDEFVRRRIESREPVAYIVGEAWFCGLPFFADERALIPRSPIAELIEKQFAPLISSPPALILDMCTGGGCIGIACALQFPQAEVDLVDISEASLALARKNSDRHGTSDRARTLQSNLFSEVDRQYDLIVANPPYVSRQEMQSLPPEYLHEPRHGLECEDEGLALPLQILQQAEHYLISEGLLIMEVGNSEEALQKRLDKLPMLWLEFEFGGHGVMAITSQELVKFREALN